MADLTFLKDNLQGFVPVETAAGIMDGITRGSSILRLSNVQPMTSDTKKFQVWADKPGAYWVGESDRISTTVASWIFPEMQAKKIAVIIPVTKEKLNDTTINVFEELKPQIVEAFYTAIDAACIFGDNSPFVKNIFKSATDAGNVVTRDADLTLDVSDLMGTIEDANLDPNGFAAHYGLRRELRSLRDANGNQLFVNGVSQTTLYENPIEFVRNGAFDKTKADVVAADWTKSLVGIREGIEFEILKEATLQNVTMGDGKPLSLAENDMIGIKATMRMGYLPIKDEAFAVLAPKAPAVVSVKETVKEAIVEEEKLVVGVEVEDKKTKGSKIK